MAVAFISYSRQDKAFVQQLYERLRANGREVWQDLHDIPPSAAWEQEILDGITASDAFIFVVSPASLVSPQCLKELDLAVGLHKRIIPVVCRDVDPRQAPPTVAALNWIFFRPQDNSDAAYRQLSFALDTDLAYWHTGSDIAVRARKWDGNTRNASFVLRGTELAAAERWLSEGATKQPSPSALQVNFITASRRAASRRQRTTIGFLSAGLIITLALTVIASLLAVNLQARNQTLQAQVLSGEAGTLLQNHQLDQALLLSAEANRQKPDDAITRGALWNALNASPYLAGILERGAARGGSTDTTFQQVQYSADGKTLLFNTTKAATIWDMTTLRQRISVPLTNPLFRAVLAPDGQSFVTVDGIGSDMNAGQIIQWSATTGQQIAQIGQVLLDVNGLSTNHEVSYSPNGTLLAIRSCSQVINYLCVKGGVAIFDVHQHKQVALLELDNAIAQMSVAFAADNTTLAVGVCTDDGTGNCNQSQLSVWNVATKKRLRNYAIPASAGDLYDMAFSASGSTIVTGGTAEHCFPTACRDSALVVYDAKTFHVRRKITEPDLSILQVAISADGLHVVYAAIASTFYPTTTQEGWRIINAVTGTSETGLPLTVFNLIGAFPRDLAISPDGQHWVSVDNLGQLILWRFTPYTQTSIPVGPDLDGTSTSTYAPDGQTIATATGDGMIIIWDAHTHQERAKFATGINGANGINDLIFTPDGNDLLAGEDSGTISIWDVHSHQQVGVPLVTATAGDTLANPIIKLVVSGDGSRLISTNSLQRIELWDLPGGKLLHDFTKDYIDSSSGFLNFGATISNNGRFIAVPSNTNGTFHVVLLDAQTYQPIRQITGFAIQVTDLDLSADGQLLAVADFSGSISAWHTNTGQQIFEVQVPTQNFAYASTQFFPSVQFNADASKLVATNDNGFLIWDMSKNTQFVPPTLLPNYVLSADFAPDSSAIAVGLFHGSVAIQSLQSADLRAEACTIVNRNLTHAEWNQFVGSSVPYQATCPQFG